MLPMSGVDSEVFAVDHVVDHHRGPRVVDWGVLVHLDGDVDVVSSIAGLLECRGQESRRPTSRHLC